MFNVINLLVSVNRFSLCYLFWHFTVSSPLIKKAAMKLKHTNSIFTPAKYTNFSKIFLRFGHLKTYNYIFEVHYCFPATCNLW